MSFDEHELAELHEKERLNPFRAGRCLSTKGSCRIDEGLYRLNPFRAGRCLSTNIQQGIERVRKVSIPFEQGDVFRRE